MFALTRRNFSFSISPVYLVKIVNLAESKARPSQTTRVNRSQQIDALRRVLATVNCHSPRDVATRFCGKRVASQPISNAHRMLFLLSPIRYHTNTQSTSNVQYINESSRRRSRKYQLTQCLSGSIHDLSVKKKKKTRTTFLLGVTKETISRIFFFLLSRIT